MAQNWTNTDGLFLQFGTDKAIAETFGDYQQPGGNRVIEGLVDLTKLTTTAAIQSNTLIFPTGANIFVESVEVVTEKAAATGTSFSLGLIAMDRSTIPSNYSTAFISALVTASVTYVGQKTILTEGSTSAGLLLGAASTSGIYPGSGQTGVSAGPYYITALSAGSAFTTGLVRVRIAYHGIGTISQ